jgi:DNA-directed RNA polymerase specialized sigma24 family protein
MPTNRPEQEAVGQEAVMRAVLALLADEREARIANDEGARKTEVLIANAGLSISETATVLGKKYETVKKTLQAAKKKTA